MNLEEFEKYKNKLATESYRVIRKKINNFESTATNEEIAGFVKGVVALQTELFKMLQTDYNKSLYEDDGK